MYPNSILPIENLNNGLNTQKTTPRRFLTPRNPHAKQKIRIVPPFSTQSLQKNTIVWSPPKTRKGTNGPNNRNI